MKKYIITIFARVSAFVDVKCIVDLRTTPTPIRVLSPSSPPRVCGPVDYNNRRYLAAYRVDERPPRAGAHDHVAGNHHARRANETRIGTVSVRVPASTVRSETRVELKQMVDVRRTSALEVALSIVLRLSDPNHIWLNNK
ncbi:hypothetical protein EVAR_74120_1, partial [Eumeta japonica]